MNNIRETTVIPRIKKLKIVRSRPIDFLQRNLHTEKFGIPLGEWTLKEMQFTRNINFKIQMSTEKKKWL